MASENNEIGDIVKKCKILLLDIEGTTTSISFVKDTLFPYAEAHVKEFLESQWDTENVKEAVAALRKLAAEDEEKKVEGVVAISGEDAGKEEQIEGLVKSVLWQMSTDRKVGPLKQLQGLIWKQGYDNGDIKGHVYDDVAPALALWNSSEGQKVYIYSSGSVQAQKLLFNKSAAGDLLPQIEGHFDTTVGGKQEAASYAAIVEKIGCKPEEILFLTDIAKEAEAARSSGLQAALVCREGNAPVPAEATFPVLRSFDQLTVSNKRKPEPQEQEVPAKVPKTDVEANVKTVAAMEVPEAAAMEVPNSAAETVSETVAPSETVPAQAITAVTANDAEPEKMEVEEEISVTEATTITEHAEVAKKTEETDLQVETVVEKIPISNDAGDTPVCNIKPIVEKCVEKTDKIETEKMETESAEVVETVEAIVEPKEQVQEKVKEESSPVAEETLSTVIIQDVTNDHEMISGGTELVGESVPIIEEPHSDDLVPIVEEPPADDLAPVVEEHTAVEMEDLNNVADVLDKECDEILLKVQGVTNLDSMPIKPLLNSIAEEDIDTENGENTNDIMDSILDSEMELAVKPSEDIDINTVTEITDAKADGEAIADKVEGNTKVNKAEDPTSDISAVKNIVTENIVEEKTEKIEVSCSETITEVRKDDVSVATVEVSNGDKPECPVGALPEPELTTQVENNESKEVTDKIAENSSNTKTCPVEPEDNKMESKESTVMAVESRSESKESEMEIADSIAKPVEANEPEQSNAALVEKTLETKEGILEQSLDNKMESEDSTKVEKIESEVKESNPAQIDTKNETEKTGVEPGENKIESDDNKMESEDSVPQENQAKEIVPEVVAPDSNVTENVNETPISIVPETESKENVSNDVAMETEATETVNGKLNGKPEVNQNGDASKEEELSARLSVENGDNDKEMNGANGNGNSSEIEKEQGEKKETDIPDIKVKTVSTDEPRTDPIEQPVEA